MSNAIFPSNLPGIKWDRVRTVTFKTSVYEALSGAERRIRHRPSPKRRVELAYEALRETPGLSELQILQGFYEARAGAYDSFLFHDPYDGQVTNLQFGLGDGVATQFQLVRTIGSVTEVVHNPEPTLAVGRVWFPAIADDSGYWPQPDGMWSLEDEYIAEEGSWTLLPNGIVSFTVAPPAGKRLLWTGRFFYRARFADDTFDSTEFLRRLFTNRKLAMVLSLQNIL
ncbi:DUF2460 domain-containing protein [Polaromonas sp.]|uniref:DUF2460 domain-containing protein n=1 Tax=Polaromonas sp. TaxID=1869339 RepID=UPI003BB584B8